MVQQGEKRLLNEWLKEKHREHVTWTNVRMGKAYDNKEARMFSVMLRYADAVVMHEGILYIVEAKIKPSAGAIGQLEDYGRLIRETPMFADFKIMEVRLLLLSATMDAHIKAVCEEKGIIFEHFPREWIIL